jgi:hypothetical protein
VQLALGLGDDLDHLDRPGLQVDPAPAQPGHLTDAQPTEGAEQDQRPVLRCDGIGQLPDLGGGEEPHLLALDPGQGQPGCGHGPAPAAELVR